jgi:hypothetical protein
MPEIYTTKASTVFQAGKKMGQTAKQIYEEEKLREDARFAAQQQLQREQMANQQKESEMNQLLTLQKMAQDKILQDREIAQKKQEEDKKLKLETHKEALDQGFVPGNPDYNDFMARSYNSKKSMINSESPKNLSSQTTTTDTGKYTTPKAEKMKVNKQEEINDRQINMFGEKLVKNITPYNDVMMRMDELEKNLGFTLEEYDPKKNNIPGISNTITGKRIISSPEAANIQNILQDVMNSEIKKNSGAQTSIQEIQRNLQALAQGGTFQNEQNLIKAFQRLKKYTNTDMNNIIASVPQSVIKNFVDNGGEIRGTRNEKQKWVDDYLKGNEKPSEEKKNKSDELSDEEAYKKYLEILEKNK